MRIVFKLNDGRTIEVPSDQVQLTCPDSRIPDLFVVSDAEGKRIGKFIPAYTIISVDAVTVPKPSLTEFEKSSLLTAVAKLDASVEWCEALYKLEDKRENN